MTPGDTGLHEIGEIVQEARQLLLKPSAPALETCTGLLECAAVHLSAWKETHRHPINKESAAAVAHLRLGISRVAALLDNAGAFYIGWAQQYGLIMGGYTPTGEPSERAPQGKLSLQG